MNRDLNSFYNRPQKKTSTREKELEKRIEILQTDLDEKNNGDDLVDEQLRVMEESYKMAARYMPSMQGQAQQRMPQQSNTSAHNVPSKEDKKVVHVFKLKCNEVSALQQHISDSAFIKKYSKPVNTGFYTAGVNKNEDVNPNTIKACIYSDQSVVSGQNVKLRLLEPIKAGGLIIPRHKVITGIATIQGERLSITVSSLEYLGKIMPVEISVYDVDGQRGIYIPFSMEREAAKQITSQMGANSGTSISINQQSASQQLLTDMGKSVIQGTSQYISKRLQTVKVNLKAGYKLMLLPDKDFNN